MPYDFFFIRINAAGIVERLTNRLNDDEEEEKKIDRVIVASFCGSWLTVGSSNFLTPDHRTKKNDLQPILPLFPQTEYCVIFLLLLVIRKLIRRESVWDCRLGVDVIYCSHSTAHLHSLIYCEMLKCKQTSYVSSHDIGVRRMPARASIDTMSKSKR